jgi:molecular chaperone DnaK (HSP70)
MATFVGIDLGTTNTSIATFDGRVVEVKKSLGGVIGQSETTPSAIFIDENQQMYIGSADFNSSTGCCSSMEAHSWNRRAN